jgi:hypothetical protein
MPAAIPCDTKTEMKLKVKDVDDAFETLEHYLPQLGHPLSPQEDRRILRKIDLRYVMFEDGLDDPL